MKKNKTLVVMSSVAFLVTILISCSRNWDNPHDKNGTNYNSEQEIKLPEVSTNGITSVKATSATCGGKIISDGGGNILEKGVCWSTSENPEIPGNMTIDGAGSDDYISQITGLTENTKYYVRAWAKNEKGISYGNQVTFTPVAGLPLISTDTIKDITTTSVVVQCNVTDQGANAVKERGVCYGINPVPTVADNKKLSGTGAGLFDVPLTGLTEGTIYYVRAYAMNDNGISYGEQMKFVPESGLPVVVTSSTTEVDATTVKVLCNITDQGATAVTERGIYYSTSENPELNNGTKTPAPAAATGAFEVTISQLAINTTYYVKLMLLMTMEQAMVLSWNLQQAITDHQLIFQLLTKQ